MLSWGNALHLLMIDHRIFGQLKYMISLDIIFIDSTYGDESGPTTKN